MASILGLPARASRFVRAARVAHLATSDGTAQPHVIPICFVFYGKEFFSPIDEKPKRLSPLKLKRLRNLSQNPKVSLVVDRYEENWHRLAYVLVFGKARLLRQGARHRKAVMLLRRKYAQYRSMGIDERPMIVIKPLRVVSWGRL